MILKKKMCVMCGAIFRGSHSCPRLRIPPKCKKLKPQGFNEPKPPKSFTPPKFKEI